MPVKGPKETAIACAISATSLRAAVCVTWRVAAIVTSVEIMMSCVSSAPASVSVLSLASSSAEVRPLATTALC